MTMEYKRAVELFEVAFEGASGTFAEAREILRARLAELPNAPIYPNHLKIVYQ